MNPFPLSLGRFDHYTLIVPNAAECSRFHTEVLGFGWVREQKVNAGSAPEGEFDMLNHVLHLPGDPSRVVVVTEGLTEDSIFRKYLEAHGPGIHHIAYAVDNLAKAFRHLEEAGIATTSNRIVHDPLSGLRQVFISREQTGYFIELIERTETAEEGTFKEGNMAELANSMRRYLHEEEGVESVASEVRASLPGPLASTMDFIADLKRLPLWTAHQTVMLNEQGNWIERRMMEDVPLKVSREGTRVDFLWSLSDGDFRVEFHLEERKGRVHVTVPMPDGVTGQRAIRTAVAIQSELILLASALGDPVDGDELSRAREEVGRFHLEVYARQGG